MAIIGGFQARITSGETTLEELAKTESDCSSAKRGIDFILNIRRRFGVNIHHLYSVFGRGQMQKAFEDATYALKVGELSGPIESDRLYF